MKRVLRIFLVGFIICVVVTLLFVIVALYLYPPLGETTKPYIKKAYRYLPLQISCTIPIPPEYGTLTFLRHGIHPSLSPYEYKLKFTKGSTVVGRSLPSDSRSLTLINIYWYPANQQGGPWLRLQHQEGEYVVDMKEHKVSRILRYKGHVFAGQLSGDQEGVAIVESGGKILISVGRRDAYEVTGTPVGDSSGEYIGRIEENYYRLRFIPPSQSPEQRMRILD
ncbi:MAG: hypothetical protein ACLQGU_16505 [bacterium]